MDFSWSAQQKKLFDAIEHFAREELSDQIVGRDRAAVFDISGWKKCGKFGIQGFPTPKEYGGLGLDALTVVGSLERLGYACKDNGLLFSINAHLWTVVMPLITAGTEEQKRKYLPGLS